MVGEPSINTFGQFELHPLLGSVGKALCFSQSPFYMMISVAVVLAFLYYGIKPAAIVAIPAIYDMTQMSVLFEVILSQ